MEYLTQRWILSGPFSAKSQHFFRFSKKSRGGSPPPPPSCAPALPVKLDGNTLTEKRIAKFDHFPLITQYVIQYFVHIIFKPVDLNQMRMGWIRNNSVGKKRSGKKNI